jgi:hypothetical protein
MHTWPGFLTRIEPQSLGTSLSCQPLEYFQSELTASSKRAESKKKEDQDRQFAAAQTLVDAGNFAGATQVLSQAMATPRNR